MRAICCRIILGLGLLLVAGWAAAARVEGLYTAEVGRDALVLLGSDPEEAEGRSQEAMRQDLMRAALARVVIRVTGSSEAVSDPKVRAQLLDQAPSLVNRFQYLEREGTGGARIRVAFHPESVQSGLWEAEWPVWGPVRPELLAWVAVRDGGELRLASPDSRPELYRALGEAADRYGLPLQAPLMDGTDRRRLGARDLLLQDWSVIEAASERYQPQGLLVLRLSPGSEGAATTAEWVLRQGAQTLTFSSEGPEIPEAVDAGLKEALAGLAERFAVHSDARAELRVTVAGVSDLAGHARTQRGLAGLTAVTDLQPVGVDGKRAEFRLRFRGQPEDARTLLGLLETLSPAESADNAEDPSRLRFRYRP